MALEHKRCLISTCEKTKWPIISGQARLACSESPRRVSPQTHPACACLSGQWWRFHLHSGLGKQAPATRGGLVWNQGRTGLFEPWASGDLLSLWFLLFLSMCPLNSQVPSNYISPAAWSLTKSVCSWASSKPWQLVLLCQKIHCQQLSILLLRTGLLFRSLYYCYSEGKCLVLSRKELRFFLTTLKYLICYVCFQGHRVLNIHPFIDSFNRNLLSAYSVGSTVLDTGI